jgi:hypothetical protein
MKTWHLLLPLCSILASCATQQSFKITEKSKSGASFKSVYRPYNVHGGRSVHAFAFQARDYTVGAALSAAANQGAETSALSLTEGTIDYSLSGRYTFTISGRMSFGAPPKNGLVVNDSTGLIAASERRGQKNKATSMIISPGITLIEDALIGDALPADSKFKYSITEIEVQE